LTGGKQIIIRMIFVDLRVKGDFGRRASKKPRLAGGAAAYSLIYGKAVAFSPHPPLTTA
jgi:hypothetical protein